MLTVGLQMDCSSLALALELQRQDLESWQRSSKGKQRAGEHTDSELALEAYRYEIDQIATYVSDRNLALSMAQAVEKDARLIADLQAVEREAERDHQLALRLSTNPGADATPTTKEEQNGEMDKKFEDDLITILESMNIREPLMVNGSLVEDNLAQAESSSWAASRKPPQKRECVICTDKFSPLFLSRMPCSHEYCRECLVRLVTAALQDESLFPPRCCGQNIPVESGRWLTPQLVGQFKAKKLELDTPNRIYCNAIREPAPTAKDRSMQGSVHKTRHHNRYCNWRMTMAGSSVVPVQESLSYSTGAII
ncbi:hypothetical protein FGRMN_10766 [Fusarium graminum]|nr:hypothetical protein FGRMN_10766 [Fusarium graminum]